MDYLKLKQHNNNLRAHQVEAKTRIWEAWNQYDAVMLQMPTGTGKTYLFTSIIHDLIAAHKEARKDVHILVVAHRTELLDQISATLSRFEIAHGFIQGQREQHLWKRVQVASIMSVLTERNYDNTLRLQYDYIIVDEAHHSLADTYVELFGLFPNAKKLGVTATPWRLNHESFLKLYQTLIPSPQIGWFIDHHLLADFDYVSIKPNSEIQRLVNRSEVADTGDFANADLDNTFNKQRIRSKLYESYEQYAKGRKGIVYAINKRHAAKVAELYCSHGVKAVAIDCDTPKDERFHYIELFKKGELKVLVNVEIFTEGFDCPNVSFIQLARPTKSLALYLQQVGRGLRIADGKEKTIIIDNVGLYNYFGLPDANRQWRHHFEGLEAVERNSSIVREPRGELERDYELTDDKFLEDNERMMVVRGATHEEPLVMKVKTTEQELSIAEFSLCDYYLVRGNALQFKIYPFIKKKGKSTAGVAGCVYAYDDRHPICFCRDTEKNRLLIGNDPKLYAIISFVALLIKRDINQLVDLNQLYGLVDVNFKSKIKSVDSIVLFDFLHLLSKL